MTSTIVAAARASEALQIHHATCRARRASLLCGTCSELAERASRLAAAIAIEEAA